MVTGGNIGLENGYSCCAVKCDLSKFEDTDVKFNEVLKKLDGKLYIIINNAGVQRRNPCAEFLKEDFDDAFNVNIKAVFLSSSASDYLSGAIIPVDGGYLGK